MEDKISQNIIHSFTYMAIEARQITYFVNTEIQNITKIANHFLQ